MATWKPRRGSNEVLLVGRGEQKNTRTSDRAEGRRRHRRYRTDWLGDYPVDYGYSTKNALHVTGM